MISWLLPSIRRGTSTQGCTEAAFIAVSNRQIRPVRDNLIPFRGRRGQSWRETRPVPGMSPSVGNAIPSLAREMMDKSRPRSCEYQPYSMRKAASTPPGNAPSRFASEKQSRDCEKDVSASDSYTNHKLNQLDFSVRETTDTRSDPNVLSQKAGIAARAPTDSVGLFSLMGVEINFRASRT